MCLLVILFLFVKVTILFACSYAKVRANIYEKYAETEQLLVNAFIESLRSLDSRRMKEYARALQPFSRVHSALTHIVNHILQTLQPIMEPSNPLTLYVWKHSNRDSPKWGHFNKQHTYNFPVPNAIFVTKIVCKGVLFCMSKWNWVTSLIGTHSSLQVKNTTFFPFRAQVKLYQSTYTTIYQWVWSVFTLHYH